MPTEKTTSVPQAPTTVVPAEYAGLWVAWNFAGTRIVASGRTIQAAAQAAEAAGEKEVIFDKVPSADVRFVGRLRP